MLQSERHDRGEPRWPVGRRARTAVLADRQVEFDALGPDRVQSGVEEEGPAWLERRHHDAAQPVLLGPADVGHREVHVLETDERLARPPSRRLPAEVRQPTVVGQPRLAQQLGVGDGADVIGGPALERQPVREEHLGHDPLALHVLRAQIGVPLRGGVEPRTEVAALRRTGRLLGSCPLVEGAEMALLDVVAVLTPRRPHVPVHRDDRRARHQRPFPPAPFAAPMAWYQRGRARALVLRLPSLRARATSWAVDRERRQKDPRGDRRGARRRQGRGGIGSLRHATRASGCGRGTYRRAKRIQPGDRSRSSSSGTST